MAAKISGKKRRLLKPADFEKIMAAKSVHEAVGVLKTRPGYSRLLRSVDENLIHRGEFETIVKNAPIIDAHSLKAFETGFAKTFLKIFLMSDEIEMIKLHMRFIQNKAVDFAKSKLRANYEAKFSSYKNLKFLTENIYDSGEATLETFIKKMDGTRYYKVLSPILVSPSRENLFFYETALDAYYNKLCRRAVGKIRDRKSRELFRRFFGMKTDILNVSFIFRAKFYYNLPPEKIFPHILLDYYKINKPLITALARAKSREEAAKILKGTIYKRALLKDGDFLEAGFSKFMARELLRMFRQNRNSDVAPLIFLNLKKSEVAKIIIIVEGIRYGIERDIIRKNVEAYA
jgi:V/A-type H+-transporting ATPase subunit C